MYWARGSRIGFSVRRSLIEFWIEIPLGRFNGRSKRLEHLDYTIGEHARRLLVCVWYYDKLRNHKPRRHGLHFWRLHCDWQSKFYPIPGRFTSEPDLDYLDYPCNRTEERA